MSYNQQKIREFLSNMPKNKLPQGLAKSLEEKRQEILSGAVYADYLAEIRAKASEYRAAPIEALKFSEFRLFSQTGDRETYQRAYFARRGRLACLALACGLALAKSGRYFGARGRDLDDLRRVYMGAARAYLGRF